MLKQRYNILRFALGVFFGLTLMRCIKDPSSMSGADFIALAVGLFALLVDYWPKLKGTKHEDRK